MPTSVDRRVKPNDAAINGVPTRFGFRVGSASPRPVPCAPRGWRPASPSPRTREASGARPAPRNPCGPRPRSAWATKRARRWPPSSSPRRIGDTGTRSTPCGWRSCRASRPRAVRRVVRGWPDRRRRDLPVAPRGRFLRLLERRHGRSGPRVKHRDRPRRRRQGWRGHRERCGRDDDRARTRTSFRRRRDRARAGLGRRRLRRAGRRRRARIAPSAKRRLGRCRFGRHPLRASRRHVRAVPARPAAPPRRARRRRRARGARSSRRPSPKRRALGNRHALRASHGNEFVRIRSLGAAPISRRARRRFARGWSRFSPPGRPRRHRRVRVRGRRGARPRDFGVGPRARRPARDPRAVARRGGVPVVAGDGVPDSARGVAPRQGPRTRRRGERGRVPLAEAGGPLLRRRVRAKLPRAFGENARRYYRSKYVRDV